jgi:hypothetical protein
LLIPERGGGLVDAPDGWQVGAKGEYPHCPVYLHCPLYLPLPVATFPRPEAAGSALENPSTDTIGELRDESGRSCSRVFDIRKLEAITPKDDILEDNTQFQCKVMIA